MKKVARISASKHGKPVVASRNKNKLSTLKSKLQDVVDIIESMDDVEYESLKQILGDTILDKYMEDLQDLSHNV